MLHGARHMVYGVCCTVEAVHAHQTVDRLELHEIRSLRCDCPEVDRACAIETCAIQHTTRTTCNMQQVVCAVSGTDRAVAASEGEVVRVDPTFDRACLAHMPAEGNRPFENKPPSKQPAANKQTISHHWLVWRTLTKGRMSCSCW